MDATSLFFLEKQMLIVCSLFLLSLTSQVLDGLPRVLAFDMNTVSSFFWHSGRVILPWCQLKLVYVNTYAYQWKICFIDISMLVTNKITFHLRICFPRIFASCHGYYFNYIFSTIFWLAQFVFWKPFKTNAI